MVMVMVMVMTLSNTFEWLPPTGLNEVSCKLILQNQFIIVSPHSPDDDDFSREDDDGGVGDDNDDGIDGNDDDDKDNNESGDDALILFSTHLGPWHADPNWPNAQPSHPKCSAVQTFKSTKVQKIQKYKTKVNIERHADPNWPNQPSQAVQCRWMYKRTQR